MASADIICSSRELFGADRCALRLAVALRSAGYEPRLVVPVQRPDRGFDAAAAEAGFEVKPTRVAIASSRGVEAPGGLIPAFSAGAELQILNSAAVLGARIGKAKRRILIVREWLEPRSRAHRLLARRHRSRIDGVVAISQGVEQQWHLAAGDRAKPTFVIPDWIEENAAGEPATARAGVVCLGRFNQWKGQEVLADAFERAFPAPVGRPQLTFIGAQPGTEFEGRANEIAGRGLSAGWSVLPFTEDPTDHLRKAALLVLPSLHPEPFGLVLLEALASGCKVMAFDGGGPSDLALIYPHALELVPRSTDALANALDGWWQAGGHAQSETELELTRAAMMQHHSPEAGSAAWKALLQQVDG
jgi:glycosyltransferase involved in cell wall biosynthesis